MKIYKLVIDEQRIVIFNSAISNVFKEMAKLTSEEQFEMIKRVQFAIEYDDGALKQIDKEDITPLYNQVSDEDEWYTAGGWHQY